MGDYATNQVIQSFFYWKSYVTKTNREVDQNTIDELQTGINLQGNKTHPMKIKIIMDVPKYFIIQNILIKAIIRLVRRVANLLGYKMADFKRADLGSFYLDGLKEVLIKILNFWYIK